MRERMTDEGREGGREAWGRMAVREEGGADGGNDK